MKTHTIAWFSKNIIFTFITLFTLSQNTYAQHNSDYTGECSQCLEHYSHYCEELNEVLDTECMQSLLHNPCDDVCGKKDF